MLSFIYFVDLSEQNILQELPWSVLRVSDKASWVDGTSDKCNVCTSHAFSLVARSSLSVFLSRFFSFLSNHLFLIFTYLFPPPRIHHPDYITLFATKPTNLFKNHTLCLDTNSSLSTYFFFFRFILFNRLFFFFPYFSFFFSASPSDIISFQA